MAGNSGGAVCPLRPPDHRCGPPQIDSQYVSFWELVAASVLAFALMVAAPRWVLIPGAAATLLVFPLVAGVGFYNAPALAAPLVAICFYGSILASAAVLGGRLVRLAPPPVSPAPRSSCDQGCAHCTAGCRPDGPHGDRTGSRRWRGRP